MSTNNNEDIIANTRLESTIITELTNGNEDNLTQNEDILNTTASPSQDSPISHVQENGTESSTANRKRKYDEKEVQQNHNGNGNSSNNNSNSNKRNNSSRKSSSHNTSNSNSSSDDDVYLKLLIPSSAAGGVIGRGGEKIAQIQKDANVRMKMSKANDYYPNTNERICLIIGSVRAVLKAHEYIIERVQEKPDSSKTQSSIDEERYNQIKILIPNTTAGLLIGKGGAYIKQIKDDSGAFVQISSKQTDLPERIVTIDGDPECRNKALSLVVRKIADDPQHNSVTNLNYSSPNNSSADSAAYANNPNHMNNGQANLNKYDFNSAATYLAGLNNLALLIVNCGGSLAMTADSLKLSLRNLGYNSSATMEIIEAITVLLSYGLISKIPPAGSNNSNSNNFPGIGANLNPTNYQGGSHPHHNDNRNSNSHPSHMQSQQHHHHQQQQQNHHHYQQHNNNNNSYNHHHYNSSNQMNGGSNSNQNNGNASIGNVLQILSNTMGKSVRNYK